MPNIQKLTKNQKLRRGQQLPKSEHRHYAPYMLIVPVIAIVGAMNLVGSRAAGDREIAFQSAGDIYVVQPDAGNPTNLTFSPSSEAAPVWSPDGHKLAFLSDRSGSWQVYTAVYDDRAKVLKDVEMVDLANVTADSYPVWVDDRADVVVGKRVETRAVSYNQGDVSPNSDNIVFVDNGDIVVYDAAQKSTRTVYASPNDDTQPDWRP